mmetsp:Transcript_43876/g.92304  ORF Transcript_43876/g.92304 Transcript_43876/m.92304 type:complete len:125 (-) Transcript_43876:123-497(-)
MVSNWIVVESMTRCTLSVLYFGKFRISLAHDDNEDESVVEVGIVAASTSANSAMAISCDGKTDREAAVVGCILCSRLSNQNRALDSNKDGDASLVSEGCPVLIVAAEEEGGSDGSGIDDVNASP